MVDTDFTPRETLLNIHKQNYTPNYLTWIYNNSALCTGYFISCITIPCCCCAPIKIIYQNNEGLLTRFGIFTNKLQPGAYSYNICTDEIKIVSLGIKVLPIKDLKVITSDNLSVLIDAVCFFKIYDSYKATFCVENYIASLTNLCKSVLRTVIGENKLSTIFKGRLSINTRIEDLLRKHTVDWGIEDISVDIEDIMIPLELQCVMAKTAEIAQDAQSKIISAEGEKRAAEIMVQASELLKNNPEAMELLWFNTLKDISKEKSNTIIVSESISTKFNPIQNIINRD